MVYGLDIRRSKINNNQNMKVISLFVFVTLALLTVKSQDLEKVINITDSISLSMVQKTFEPRSHSIIYNDNGLVLLIDDYLVYGTDATMPKAYLSKAELFINGKVYCLNTKGMYDPNLKVLNSEMVSVTQSYPGYIVRMLLSVGAGYYGVEWTIIGDKSYRTVLTNDWKFLNNGFVLKNDFFDEEPKE
jgi:hypothetical protein